jgi:surfeit locus 1 family protein
MTRRVPLLATLVVLAAVAVMIALGVWQLARKAEKEALLARFAQAQAVTAPVRWPAPGEDPDTVLYRRAMIDCLHVERIAAVAGRSARGQSGWAQVASCRLADGDVAQVAIGWSREARAPAWSGGVVEGIIGPAGRGIRLVATQPQAGLEPLAAPDPASIPNNHLSYAVQWFFFAGTALVIYVLALRRRARP